MTTEAPEELFVASVSSCQMLRSLDYAHHRAPESCCVSNSVGCPVEIQ